MQIVVPSNQKQTVIDYLLKGSDLPSFTFTPLTKTECEFHVPSPYIPGIKQLLAEQLAIDSLDAFKQQFRLGMKLKRVYSFCRPKRRGEILTISVINSNGLSVEGEDERDWINFPHAWDELEITEHGWRRVYKGHLQEEYAWVND